MHLHLPKADYWPLPPKRLMYVRYALAGVFIVLVLAQLFAFEKMGTLISGDLPELPHELATPLAALLVALEVAALPCLLIMPLSPLGRICSRLAGPLSLAMWYVLIYCGILTARLPNSGLLGEKVNIPTNFLALLIVMILFAVTVAVQYVDVKSVPAKE